MSLGDLQVANRTTNCQSSKNIDKHELAVCFAFWQHRTVNRPDALEEHTSHILTTNELVCVDSE
jgi:hypothetical protein